MVDFRYHLVTIISVFLALAVGIVVGALALSGPVLDGLRGSNASLISEKRALESDVQQLRDDVDTGDDFARALSDDLVGGALQDQGVLLVTAPDASGQVVDHLETMLTEAGAGLTGRLALQPELLDPAQGQLVDDLVAGVVQGNVEVLDDTPVARAAAQLAAALAVRPGDAPVDRAAAQEVVSAFEEAGLVELTGNGEELDAATLVVLVAAPASAEPLDQDDAAASALDGLLAVAGAFDAASGGALVAGPPEALLDGGLVRQLRADSELDNRVSSVDNADRAVGQVAVVLALREQLAGEVGGYGGGQGASAPVPTAAAAPSEE